MRNMNSEKNTNENLHEKVAQKVSNFLSESVKGSKNYCQLICVGEPKYPIELLKEDSDN